MMSSRRGERAGGVTAEVCALNCNCFTSVHDASASTPEQDSISIPDGGYQSHNLEHLIDNKGAPEYWSTRM